MSVNVINSNAFCVEDITNIENYEKALKDKTQTYACHHRLETHTSDGERRKVDLSKEELIALGMYYHRPAEELVFMTRGEHTKLHNENKKWGKGFWLGKHLPDEARRKIVEAQKGKPSPKKGKKYVLYKCMKTGETGTINDWSKRKFYHVNYGKSKGFTFIREEKAQ